MYRVETTKHRLLCFSLNNHLKPKTKIILIRTRICYIEIPLKRFFRRRITVNIVIDILLNTTEK